MGRPLLSTYPSIHQKLYRVQGSARRYLCVECGAQARHWSYNGGCDEELSGPETHGRGNLLFCMHLEHYSPRCVACHKAHDREHHLRGSDHPNAKLTDSQVRWAREVHAMGKLTSNELGELLGVGGRTMRRILSGERYKPI